MNLFRSCISAVVFACAAGPAVGDAGGVGFLIVAPDRGFLGNQEIRSVFEEFQTSYAPAALAFIGRDYNGVGTEYSAYLSRAVQDLKQAGAAHIVAIPLFLSQADPVLSAVEQIITPLKARYQLELIYGMGDPVMIQQAVTRLETRGIRRIVFARMYALSHHMKDRIDYILGLAEKPAAREHDHRPPAQVRSASLFAAFGGYEEHPGVAQILHQRIMEVSRDPARETVLLLAHGDRSEEGNAAWLRVMHVQIERLKQDPHCARLHALRAATAREDWPELRDRAMADIKVQIREDAKRGPVLVIADRLYGAGPYKRLLSDVDYVLNDKGLAHPLLTRWLEEQVAATASALAGPPADADPVPRR